METSAFYQILPRIIAFAGQRAAVNLALTSKYMCNAVAAVLMKNVLDDNNKLCSRANPYVCAQQLHVACLSMRGVVAMSIRDYSQIFGGACAEGHIKLVKFMLRPNKWSKTYYKKIDICLGLFEICDIDKQLTQNHIDIANLIIFAPPSYQSMVWGASNALISGANEKGHFDIIRLIVQKTKEKVVGTRLTGTLNSYVSSICDSTDDKRKINSIQSLQILLDNGATECYSHMPDDATCPFRRLLEN